MGRWQTTMGPWDTLGDHGMPGPVDLRESCGMFCPAMQLLWSLNHLKYIEIRIAHVFWILFRHFFRHFCWSVFHQRHPSDRFICCTSLVFPCFTLFTSIYTGIGNQFATHLIPSTTTRWLVFCGFLGHSKPFLVGSHPTFGRQKKPLALPGLPAIVAE